MADIKIITVNWAQYEPVLRDIRKIVFIDEQSVPEALEWDEFDKESNHFLVSKGKDHVATGRLKPDGQIGRMAVLKEYRRSGIGSLLLDHILEHARTAGLDKVYCHAQVSAIDFYLKKGFEFSGDIFLDANIPHQAMFKKLCY